MSRPKKDNEAVGAPLRGRSRIWFRVEDALIILCIASVWPTVLRLHGTFYSILQLVALCLLVVICVLRLRRISRARREAEQRPIS